MVNKKRILTLCLCFSMFMLAGCVKSKDLTEEEQDIIAEYSAGILLQHDNKYSRRLVKAEQTAEPESTNPPPIVTPEPTQEPNSETGQQGDAEEEEQVNEVALNELYHVSGMNIRYDSYTICDAYPKKSSEFQLTAKKGERLLVVRFQVKNTTKKDLKINLMKRQLSYPVDLDGTTYDPTIVIQENGGLNYLKTTLKANASEEAILVYAIPDESSKPESIVLTAKDGDNVSTIKVK